MKKFVSLALCLAMMFSILPMGSLKLYADVVEPEIIWLEKDYAQVGIFSEGLAVVAAVVVESPYNVSGKFGFIDKTGKEVVTPKYTITEDFSEGLAMVNLYGNVGFIDKTGKEVIPLKYNQGWSFSEGLAMVELYGNVAFIDKTGKEVIPLKYDQGWSFSEGLAGVCLDGKCGYIDKNGKEVVDLKYDRIMGFNEGLSFVDLDGKWRLIDKNGEEVIDLKYDHIESFSEGFAAVGVGDYETVKWGFIDKTGKEVIPPKYDDADKFREGLAVIRIGDRATGKWGAIDKTGREVIPPKYDSIGRFSEGLAAVELNGKWGFIDKTGKEVIAPKYNATSNFSEGLAGVELNGKWGIMKNPLAKASAKPQDSEKPQASADNGITAKYSTSKLSIDGVAAQGMEIYNISDNNYFKLRDVAKLLNDTDKKFSVGWNNEKKLISLVSGQNYVTTGGELSGGDGVDKSAVISTAKMELNGKEVNLKAYTIGGNNYFKLRDLCEILGVKVDWDQATQTILLKTK